MWHSAGAVIAPNASLVPSRISMIRSYACLLKHCARVAASCQEVVSAGTVIAPNASLILVPSITGFRQRSEDPQSGQGYQVQAGLSGTLTGPGALQLAAGNGNVVASSPSSAVQATAG